ncbi:MAG TPA: class I SAM-dependent methyltransferase, partial [Verrucomicrobiota bacterium]|nr:class I SAM-dependent methyltransferase [Verrucomicrobiota bacterium]
MNAPDARTELFRSSWSLYDTVIERNYMFHRQIHDCVRCALRERWAGNGYRLLDLGCGNARLLADTLSVVPPARYLGVDLSRTALDEAAAQLKALPSVELREQEMLACALEAPPSSFDVAYSSFAAHHLTAEDKRRLFGAVAESLASDGEFLLVDVVRGENQTRDAYLEDYLRMMRTEWNALDSEQIKEACAHVAT